MLKPEEESQMDVTTLQPKITIAETPPIDKKPSVVFCKICLSGSSTEQLLQPCICKGIFNQVILRLFLKKKNAFVLRSYVL